MSEVIELVRRLAGENRRRADEEMALAAVRLGTAIADELGTELHSFSGIQHLEYDIAISWPDIAAAELPRLSWLRSLEIAAAPELAATIEFDERTVIIRRYWPCPGERRVRPLDRQLTAEALARYRADTQRIASHGKIHAYARGLGHMSVAEHSGTIVLNGWHALRPATDDEIREHLEDLDELIALSERTPPSPGRR